MILSHLLAATIWIDNRQWRKKRAWSASASVVIKLVIFPDANCFRASWVSLRDLRNTAATYNEEKQEKNKLNTKLRMLSATKWAWISIWTCTASHDTITQYHVNHRPKIIAINRFSGKTCTNAPWSVLKWYSWTLVEELKL